MITYSCLNGPEENFKISPSEILEKADQNYKCVFEMDFESFSYKFHSCYEFELAPVTNDPSNINYFRRNFSNAYISDLGITILSIFKDNELKLYTYNHESGELELAKTYTGDYSFAFNTGKFARYSRYADQEQPPPVEPPVENGFNDVDFPKIPTRYLKTIYLHHANY